MILRESFLTRYILHTGLTFLKDLAIAGESIISSVIESKYLALASFSAVISYAEYSLRANFLRRALRVRYIGADHTLLFEPQTISSLELLYDVHHGDKKKSLIAVIDHCLTRHGQALLRANLLQPPTDKETIQHRQAAAMELCDDYIYENVKLCLKEMVDIDRMST